MADLSNSLYYRPFSPSPATLIGFLAGKKKSPLSAVTPRSCFVQKEGKKEGFCARTGVFFSFFLSFYVLLRKSSDYCGLLFFFLARRRAFSRSEGFFSQVSYNYHGNFGNLDRMPSFLLRMVLLKIVFSYRV